MMKSAISKILRNIVMPLVFLFIVFEMFYNVNIEYEVKEVKTENPEFIGMISKDDAGKVAKELVGKMTLDEKIDQLHGGDEVSVLSSLGINTIINKRFPHIYVGGNERLNIPPWVLSEGTRGARVMHPQVNSVTVFPVAMARGASWDTDLEYRVHEAIAIEMRANGVNYAASPCVNVLRHPGWGRAQETYGEDPWHLGSFGMVATKALQKHNLMAGLKYFALNSMENSRWVLNVKADERTMREVYLPQFKRIIQQEKPASIITAYNAVNNEFCGSNGYLLKDILRGEWGFDGFVTSGWLFGLYDGIAGIKAGQNVEMPRQKAYSDETIKTGIRSGSITEADIDTLVIQSLRTRLKYLVAQDIRTYGFEDIASEEHINLARETAEKGMVLLKNEGVLPFKEGKGKKIAVIGRLANMANTGDQGTSNATPPYVITPYEGIRQMQDSLGNEVILNDGTDVKSAMLLAKEVDEVIVVVGFSYKEEGEFIIFDRNKMLASARAKRRLGTLEDGGDRAKLNLIEAEEHLLNELIGINKNTVITYIGGGGIDMSTWSKYFPAILFAWYPGMEGGHALANILYGKATPGGKLPFTIAETENDYPEFNPYTQETTFGYYHGYTLFEKEKKNMAYPFGFGLSYTRFQTGNPVMEQTKIKSGDTLKVSLSIKNTGKIKGSEVLQLYVGFKNSKTDRPVKLLRDFKRIYLDPGQQETVNLTVAANDLKWFNPQSCRWELEFMEYELYIGTSSANEDLVKRSFTILPSD